MRVVVARRALRQIDEIHVYIAARRRRSADDFLNAVAAVKARLADYPYSSPLLREPDFYQSTVAGFPYVVTYRVSGNRIMILGVFHAARHPSVRSRP